MPGELDEEHSALSCEECHTPWEGALDSSCTECHENQAIHWHNNSVFGDDCRSCHILHGGDTERADLDCISCHPEVHDGIGYSNDDCLSCHTPSGTVLSDYTHSDPYVQRIMEKDDHKDGEDCYLCHDTQNFDEYNCLSSNCHGTSKYDDKHDEEDENWKMTDCFEYGCHSRTADDGSDDDNDLPESAITEADGETALCLLLILILAVLFLIIGYIYLKRAMER